MTRCACPCRCSNIVKTTRPICRLCEISVSCRGKQGTVAAMREGKWGRRRRR